MPNRFILKSPFKPTGDQPQAIEKLIAGLKKGYRDQTLLGVTGSGKTFTMANVIAAVQKPTLVISHNKTLAAQLASEFKEFFPSNAVDYFVSYYDYYQPEAYIPKTDTYIEKETEINDEIDRLRNAATRDLMTRKDVLIVASVSCIYGIGTPEEYAKAAIRIRKGETRPRKTLLRKLIEARYKRNDLDLQRGTFRTRGDSLEIFPAYEETVFRILFYGDKVEDLLELDPLTGKPARKGIEEILVFPAKQFLTPEERLPQVMDNIRTELAERASELKKQDKLLEAQRLMQRTNFDLEMIRATGYCTGIENYSRHFDFRKPGQPPATLFAFFPKDFLLIIDESHMTLPQIRGMHAGDQARKGTLVNYGFRLPSAKDNRPLQYEEFNAKIKQVLYASATPAPEELQKSKQVVEQLIRPTGLLDPKVEVKPIEHQVDDLQAQIKERVKRKERVLVTTLTKRMAEDLTEYLKELGVKVHYLHSDVETFDRLETLRALREGTHDVVVGINLLREGLDLPEVSLVAILDADKEGYLRSETALVQTMGRAARHVNGTVIMYADRLTGSMRRAIAETERRRKIQEAYNKTHGITPTTIQKAIRDDRLAGKKRADEEVPKVDPNAIPPEELGRIIRDLSTRMDLAARNLEFEKAAALRDEIALLRKAERTTQTAKRT